MGPRTFPRHGSGTSARAAILSRPSSFTHSLTAIPSPLLGVRSAAETPPVPHSTNHGSSCSFLCGQRKLLNPNPLQSRPGGGSRFAPGSGARQPELTDPSGSGSGSAWRGRSVGSSLPEEGGAPMAPPQMCPESNCPARSSPHPARHTCFWVRHTQGPHRNPSTEASGALPSPRRAPGAAGRC